MISVIVIDDEQLIASSLATLLELEEDLVVVATFYSGEAALSWWQNQSVTPDVCITDLQLGGIDGVEVGKKIMAVTPTAKVLIVTSHSRPVQLKRALAAGIQGFMAKTSSAEEFATAIRTMHQGKRYIDPELAALTISSGNSPLTEREAEVLEAAGTGGSVEEIAASVFLAVGTTRNYLSSAMAKLNAQNRFEAYLRAREAGWI